MRRLTLLLALSIAGCGGSGPDETVVDRDNGSGIASNELVSADEPDSAPQEPPAGAPASPQLPAPRLLIPAAFQGRYDRSAADCGRPSEYRLEVTPDSLRFHESIGDVRSVTAESPNALSINAHFEGEGEGWFADRRIELSDDGRTITISGDGTSVTRVRCP